MRDDAPAITRAGTSTPTGTATLTDATAFPVGGTQCVPSVAMSMAMSNKAPVDPIELEIVRNLFEAAAEEMGIVLQRVAFSANIKERRNFSCAVFDADGQLLAQAAHIPVHLGSMPASVQAVRDRLGALAEGDVAIVNDPFAGGTHLPDITLVSPVFYDGRLIGYAANRAHHADVGGISPGSMTASRHIDEEGVRIHPSLLDRGGVRDAGVLHRLLSAVRTPDERLGDLEAQVAANAVGVEALRRMAQRRGVDTVARYGHALLDYARAFMARTIAAIPEGGYDFEDALDGLGAGPIGIRAHVTIRGGRATVDLRGCDDQVPGPVNCPDAVARSAVYYCFACLMGETDDGVPLNAGCFRDIDVLTRPGSVVHAVFPAAVVAGNTETSQRIVDVILGALAKALPHRIPAASCGTMSSVALGGTRPGGERWTYYETIGGGCGAGPGWDGASAIQCHMTNTLNTPAEALELQYPLRVRRFERATGTGGRGRFRGGDGIVREIQALAPCEGTVLADRRKLRPYGLDGGEAGGAGVDQLFAAGAPQAIESYAKEIAVGTGSILSIRTPGGGGHGIDSAIDPNQAN